MPIIPEFLYNLHHQEDLEIINETLPISAIVDQGHSERSQLLSKVFSDTSPKFSIQCQKEVSAAIVSTIQLEYISIVTA